MNHHVKKMIAKSVFCSMLLSNIIFPTALINADNNMIRGNLKVRGNGTFCGELSTRTGLNVCGPINQKHTVYPLTKKDIKRRAKNGPKSETYDVIVVGAGTAGSLLAFRLAERYPKNKILVLDVGQDDVRTTTGNHVLPNPNNPNDSWGQLLRGNGAFLGEGCAQWQEIIETDVDDQLFRVPSQYARGATLGGTSAVNAEFWNRGTKAGTYDRWEAATGDPAFGFLSMVEAYKKIENRTQSTQFFGEESRFWYENNQNVPAGQQLNRLMGKDGRMFLTSLFRPGWDSRAISEALSEGPLPGRDSSIQTYLADVDENNPMEYGYLTPFTNYSQADPDFLDYNPYPHDTPGYTYIPPENEENLKKGNFAGPGPDLPKADIARCYAAPAYLYPILDNTIDGKKFEHNVTIKQRVYVTKLIFDKKNKNEVIGVEYVEGENGEGWHVAEIPRAVDRDVAPYKGTASGTPTVIDERNKCSFNAAVENQKHVETKRAYAKADVWLCAGSTDSPALMQRSGIGPRVLLESLRYLPVECHVDLPGVGNALQDSLDIEFSYLQEEDFSTGLQGPAALSALSYASSFAFADPDLDSIYSPNSTASIAGAPIQTIGSYRFQSDSSKDYPDFDLLSLETFRSGFAGNFLYQDFFNFGIGLPVNVNFSKIKPVFDRAQWGYYAPEPSGEYLQQSIFVVEYWDVVGQGQVVINSGNVFERPSTAPNKAANERDLEAFSNIFSNTLFPLAKRIADKRFGPRGIATYRGEATDGGDTLTLNAELGAVKPIIGNITQAMYEEVNKLNGYTITILEGPGAGQFNKIETWSGAPDYIATMDKSWANGMEPGFGSVYALNPPGATPVDSVEFYGPNHRNFVRFANPSGDELFSSVIINELGEDPFDTEAGSTKVHVNHQNNGFENGDMIKISGVQGPVNGIDPKDINEYHIVYNVDEFGYDIILFWNLTPTGGFGSLPMPSPAVNATTGSSGGAGVKVHTLRFDEAKYRKWISTHFFSGWHGCCSNRMGKIDDLDAVVDTRGRVYCTKGLRVSDCSIFPVKPNANTQAPAYGITQKLFDLISEEEYDKLLSCQKNKH